MAKTFFELKHNLFQLSQAQKYMCKFIINQLGLMLKVGNTVTGCIRKITNRPLEIRTVISNSLPEGRE